MKLPTRFYFLSILLAVSSMSPRMARAQACNLPAAYDHLAVRSEGGLEFTLATESSSYLVGEPISMILITRNTGGSIRVIPNPYLVTPTWSFNLLPATCDSLDQPNCIGSWLFWRPQLLFFFGAPITLNPGQCVQHSFAWNGTPDAGGSSTPGSYQVMAGYWDSDPDFDGKGPSRPDYFLYLPTGGIRLPIQIVGTSAVPPTSTTSWSRIKRANF